MRSALHVVVLAVILTVLGLTIIFSLDWTPPEEPVRTTHECPLKTVDGKDYAFVKITGNEAGEWRQLVKVTKSKIAEYRPPRLRGLMQVLNQDGTVMFQMAPEVAKRTHAESMGIPGWPIIVPDEP